MSGISFEELLPTLLTAGGVLLAFWGLYIVLARLIRGLAARSAGDDAASEQDEKAWADQSITYLRRGMEVMGGLAVLVVVLRGLGLGGISKFSWDGLTNWLSTHGFRIALVAGGAYLVTRILHMLISRLPRLLARPTDEANQVQAMEQRQRLETISRLLQSVATALVMGMAALIILRELGLDITPILTGLGIGGLALGFGAQNLVRDFISGFFIIFENQVAVGDVAVINGKGGQVEAIRLRTIQIRGLDGTVHVFPNGAITELSNLTKTFSYYVIDLGVAYKENTDDVVEVVREVAAELRRDPAYSPFILDNLDVLGVDDFADSAVTIKVRIKTAPLKQWFVGRELRRRIKHAFDARGIEIPFPHLSVYVGEATKPFAVQMMEQAGAKANGGPRAAAQKEKV